MDIRRWIERTLLLAGVIGLGVWAWSLASTAILQDWGSWSFDRAMHGESASFTEYLVARKDQLTAEVRALWEGPAPPQAPVQPLPPPPPQPAPPRSLEDQALVGRLAIPRLHLSAMVREGTGEGTLTANLGHIPGTALPGEMGNVGVAGHRDTLFRGLRKIRKNDVIRFETLGGSHSYQVESTEIVRPDNVSVLNAGRYPELTLVTCYPFYYVGSAPDRFIVKARLVSEGAGQTLSEKSPEEDEHMRNGLSPESTDSSRAGESGSSAIKEPTPEAESLRHSPALRKVSFHVSTGRSRELASEALFGVTRTDASDRRMDGWMWLIRERRTIWLRSQRTHEPVVFYGYHDGKKRELVITRVSPDSVTGYMLLPGQSVAHPAAVTSN